MGHSRYRLQYFVLLVVALALPVMAAPQAVPPSLLGDHSVGAFTFNNMIGPYPGGYGGAFTMNVADGTTGGPYSTPVTVWCVDYQLEVSGGSYYNASIIPLNDIQASDSRVRFGSVGTSSSAGSWVTDLGSNYDTAASRYGLTAALITQYSPTPDQPINSLQNQEIQEAIWQITQNTEYPSSLTWPDFNADPAVAGWITWAENNVDKIDLSKFVVISGAVDSDGNVVDTGYQTFEAELAPEPQAYGLLALGIALLIWKVRKNNSRRIVSE